MTSTLHSHLESFLGEIEFGVPVDAPEGTPGFGIAVSHPPLTRAAAAVWTLGLSNADLRSPVSGRHTRQELFLLCRDLRVEDAIRLVHATASAVLGGGRPMLRGQTVGPLPGDSPVRWLGAVEPLSFDADLGVVDPADGGVEVIVAQLVPLTDADVTLADTRGPDALVDALGGRDLSVW